MHNMRLVLNAHIDAMDVVGDCNRCSQFKWSELHVVC